ncbi:MAG TPA: protein kinase [Vicinamibacterales bacterium]|nr:protein kinase [Vicinamibacterales bacterium]
MQLSSGTRLGTYETLTLIGAGGMGQVYRARDTKLGRDVAIKVLPEAVTDDTERLARFRREAQILASLNHPHIATVYGLEDWHGSHFIVLELVDGGTLEQRLATGPLAFDEALHVARQLIEALQVAHEKGIVHRDLKPANIAFTSDGQLKVLDFGLAKAIADDGPAVDLSRSPTMSGGTLAGTVLGTAAYLSPEQARGLPVDKRADIWAFGCVLFEMLTRRAPFDGPTLPDIIAAVLQQEPEWSILPAEIPAPVIRLLRRCLEKDVKRRVRDIADAALYLDDAPAWTGGLATSPTPAVQARDVEFRRLTDSPDAKEAPAISPDGKTIAFVAMAGGRRQIWIRLLAGGAALQLTRDDVDHLHPRWAPDSNTLLYYTPPSDGAEQGAIWEIGALGGWPRPVTPAIGGADVSPDGRRIALLQVSGERLALVTMARDGSAREEVALLPVGFTYTFLRWSPDGQRLAFRRSSHSGFDEAIEIATPGDPRRQDVIQGVTLTGLAWLPDGSGIVYGSSRGSTLLYPPVTNLRVIRRDGSLDRQLTFGDASYYEPDAHSNGRLVAIRVRSRSDIWSFPADGSPAENTRNGARVTRQTGHVQTPSVSPNGKEVVYISDSGGHANLWIASVDGSSARQITFETNPDVAIGVVKWSPRGDLIAFLTTEEGRPKLWIVRPDGSGRRFVARAWGPCWSGDGSWLYNSRVGDGVKALEKVPVDGGPAVFVREEDAGVLPEISLDGSTLYFTTRARADILGLWSGPGYAELRRAQPEHAPSELLLRVPQDRLSGHVRAGFNVSLSPDGRWLATALVDGVATNLWRLPTTGGSMTPLTDFGDRRTFIERSICWSPDSQTLFAAVAEEEMDIVLLDGLIA